jgi:mRNA interferase RelE/StbE
MKTIIYSKPAVKDLDALPVDAREAVETALQNYAVHGRGDIKKLTGQDESYRLRVGRHRVVFNETAMTILAVYIAKRDSQTY